MFETAQLKQHKQIEISVSSVNHIEAYMHDNQKVISHARMSNPLQKCSQLCKHSMAVDDLDETPSV